MRAEMPAGPCAGVASKKNPAPNDVLMATATNPTRPRYRSVPAGIPAGPLARRARRGRIQRRARISGDGRQTCIRDCGATERIGRKPAPGRQSRFRLGRMRRGQARGKSGISEYSTAHRPPRAELRNTCAIAARQPSSADQVKAANMQDRGREVAWVTRSSSCQITPRQGSLLPSMPVSFTRRCGGRAPGLPGLGSGSETRADYLSEACRANGSSAPGAGGVSDWLPGASRVGPGSPGFVGSVSWFTRRSKEAAWSDSRCGGDWAERGCGAGGRWSRAALRCGCGSAARMRAAR